jgi:predicted AlkP superfamily phosphohydrolase/phosphomutase
MLVKSNLSKILFKIIPDEFLKREYSNLLAYSRPTLSDVDWKRTKAYSMGFYGKIFLNLIGREPAGIIEPGEEYEKLRNYLIKKLYALKDPENDERIVDEVLKKEEVYWGPYTNQAADLFFTMKDMTYITHLFTEFGADPNTLTEPPHNFQSSFHRMNGVLIITGPHIKKGIIIKNAKIIDLAPTIFHIMNVPIPSDIDGRVLKEIFDPRSDLAEREVKYVKPSRKKAETKRLSKEDDEKIKERLKALGYLG